MRHHPSSASSPFHNNGGGGGGAPPASPISAPNPFKLGKKRGSYNCGRCGLPKKGHVCNIPESSTTTTTTPYAAAPVAASNISLPTPRSRLPRALSFDNDDTRDHPDFFLGGGGGGGWGDDYDGESDPMTAAAAEQFDSEPEFDPDEVMSGGLPAGCLWQVLRRLPPPELLSAASVCKGWRECTNNVWRAAEELRLKVPARVQVGVVGSVLKRCSGLVRLSLIMESDLDATMLACIAFSCPNLESMEISTSEKSVNRITGDELGRFIADKRCLSVLKMEGCSNLKALVISSSSLSTLWLSDLHSLSKTVFNCPNIREISLSFSQQENDTTDFTIMSDNLGRSCPRLQNIHIASFRFSHSAVLALTAASLRSLRMLSLVLGSGITDASVAAITQSFSNLELLDLSGSSISDSGIGMICNVLPQTLSKLLLALCPNVSSSGIQFATAQLPLLELMDCGMTICDTNSEIALSSVINDFKLPITSSENPHLVHQKLIIKHSTLKKLSLWGCSGLDSLYLNCPELSDLNLNSCRSLHPDKLILQCPNLESVHASGCYDTLIGAIQSQVDNESSPMYNSSPLKRMADGSKRITVPHSLKQELTTDDLKRLDVCKRRRTVVY